MSRRVKTKYNILKSLLEFAAKKLKEDLFLPFETNHKSDFPQGERTRRVKLIFNASKANRAVIVFITPLILLTMAATITASEPKNYDSCAQQKPSEIITSQIVARILNKKPFEIETKKTKKRNVFSCCTTNDNPSSNLVVHFYKHPLPEHFDAYDKTSFNDYYDDEFAEPKIIDGFLNQDQITQILTAIAHNNKKPKILQQQSSHDELCSIQSSFSNDLSQTLSSSSSSHKTQDLSSLHDSFCALLPQEANSLAVSQEQISDILAGEYPTSLFFGPLVGKPFIPPHRRYRYVHPEYYKAKPIDWPKNEREETKQWKEKEKFRCK